jgi:hypothetical protein
MLFELVQQQQQLAIKAICVAVAAVGYREFQALKLKFIEGSSQISIMQVEWLWLMVTRSVSVNVSV